MATIAQIQNGLTKYVDENIVPSMAGWQKWVFGAGAAIAISNLPKNVERWKNTEVVKMLGVIDDGNNIDIQKIYQGIKRQSDKAPASIDIPGMGTITLNDYDVDTIYNYIQGGM